MSEIINKVATSGLITIDLEDYYVDGERVLFDLKPMLFQGLILKEKDFREAVKVFDWQQYKNKIVGIVCSADAIVPTWAYMLISLSMAPIAKRVFFAGKEEMESILFSEALNRINPKDYEGAKVVIKGCSNKPVPQNAYVQLCQLIQPVAKSIMYGEPCSTVPLYKSKT